MTGLRFGRASIVLLLLAALAAVLTGCGRLESSAKPERLWSSGPFVAIEQPDVPAWRLVDRNALAARLGWWDVTRGGTGSPRIALTFDAGSGGGPAPAILDTLKAHGLNCTFFLTGQFADAYPAIVRRMALEGHELGNHSWSHPHFNGITAEEAASQVSRTESRVLELTGLSTKPYFRFPYGWKSDALIRQVNGMGYLSVSWTFDSLDSLEGTSAEEIRARVSKLACPGAIVLMHCGSSQEALALPGVISDLEAAGYQLVTLTETLGP